MDFVIPDRGVRFIGDVSETVLIAEFFVDGGIDLVDGLLFRDFKKTPAGLPGYLLENLFPVRTRLFRVTMVATSAQSAHASAATVRTAETTAVSVTFFIGKQNRVNEGVGALRRFNGFL